MHPDDTIRAIFIEEVNENIEAVETGLIALEKNPEDQGAMNAVFRGMHTIKGGAGLAGLDVIGKIAHEFEDILEQIRSKGEEITNEIFSLLFAGLDVLKRMITENDLTGQELSGEITDLMERLSVYRTKDHPVTVHEPAAETTHTTMYKIEMSFVANTFETGTDPLMLLEELGESGEILASYFRPSGVPVLQAYEPQSCYLSWLIFLSSPKPLDTIYDVFIFVRDDNEINIETIDSTLEYWFGNNPQLENTLIDKYGFTVTEASSIVACQRAIGVTVIPKKLEAKEDNGSRLEVEKVEQINSIRVDTRKLEQMIDSMGELVIAQSRVKEVINVLGLERSKLNAVFNAFSEVDKIVRRVQEEVMSTSMVPIGPTFTRFQRMVRDLLNAQGKQGEFILEGSETELDRKVIEQVVDPLKHLLRNAIDHGLETPEQREIAGKDRVGRLVLRAYHKEGFVIIEVSDDGKGIDHNTVLEKAIDKGLVDSDAQLSAEEINHLLFHPGFSTAKEVSDLSGRGVGLDVVITNIQGLRGSVNVESEYGKGTTFRIRLPLTLAIIDGVIIRLSDQLFVVPTTAVSEFIKINTDDVHLVEGKGSVIDIRREFIPYIPLYKILQLEADYKTPAEGIVVILKEGEKRLAVLIDEILGHEQVVVKNVQDNLGVSAGMAGATILGDGRVSIIFDVSSLFGIARRYAQAL